MKEKRSAEAISIKSHCSESWDEMFGDEKTRACSHCEMNVNDISLMTEDEAWDLIDESNGNLCVRFEAHPVTNAPIFRDTFYQITRQTGVAAGVLGATLAVSSSVYAQDTTSNNSTKTPTEFSGVEQTDSKKVVPKPPKVSPTPKKTPIPKLMGMVAFVQPIKNPLMLAVQQGKTLKVRYLIASGADVNEIDKGYYSRTALHVAVEKNDLKMANILLNAGADLEMQDRYKNTPLMSANWAISAEIIQLFAQHGANLNAQNLSGQTALMTAAGAGNLKGVKALLESGANVFIRDNYNNSALDLTRSEGIRQVLIAYGAVEKITN